VTYLKKLKNDDNIIKEHVDHNVIEENIILNNDHVISL